MHHDTRALVLLQRGRYAVVFEQALERADDGADDLAVAGIERVDRPALDTSTAR